MAEETVSAETLAVLCCAVLEGGKTINSYYKLMSSLDGVKTHSSFEHRFRPILKRARELQAQRANGLVVTPVKAKNKRGGSTLSTPTSTKKRGRGARTKAAQNTSSGEDAEGTEDEAPLSKRVKAEPAEDEDEGILSEHVKTEYAEDESAAY